MLLQYDIIESENGVTSHINVYCVVRVNLQRSTRPDVIHYFRKLSLKTKIKTFRLFSELNDYNMWNCLRNIHLLRHQSRSVAALLRSSSRFSSTVAASQLGIEIQPAPLNVLNDHELMMKEAGTPKSRSILE